MNINDILGLGKVLPIDKLIDIVSSVTGRISKPYFDRKDIDTKAYEIKKLAEARAEEMKIISNAVRENFQLTGGIEYRENTIEITSPKEIQQNAENTKRLTNPSLEERTRERIDYQAARKQLNIESVTAYAAEQLKDEQPVTNEPLDEDWKTRFFSIAEDISNDEMQALWGRILAGEVKQPKTFSLRTLELLKNLSKNEAEVFLKFGRFAITTAGGSFILNFRDEKLLSEKYELQYNERLLLEELGLITANDLEFLIEGTADKDGLVFLILGNICVVAHSQEVIPQRHLKVLAFTKIGHELLRLIGSEPPLDYIQLLASKFRRDGVTVEYGKILSVAGDEVTYSDLKEVPLTDEERKRKNAT